MCDFITLSALPKHPSLFYRLTVSSHFTDERHAHRAKRKNRSCHFLNRSCQCGATLAQQHELRVPQAPRPCWAPPFRRAQTLQSPAPALSRHTRERQGAATLRALPALAGQGPTPPPLAAHATTEHECRKRCPQGPRHARANWTPHAGASRFAAPPRAWASKAPACAYGNTSGMKEMLSPGL